jgi:hypothetical protein
MANPANSIVQNLLPVQAYFNVDGSFNTFIGQGQPFYATANPVQSGLTITNSTINSTTIGASVPSTAVFSSGQINATPTGNTDIANKLYVDSVAVGISWKAPVTAATTVNITLSGLQTVDTVSLVAGNTVLVKNQTNTAQNGIYQVNAGAWTYATGSTTWSQYVSALVFVEYGTQAGSAWYCTAQPGGTLGTTAMTWSNFSTAANYTAGTGLTLNGYQFSITNTGVAANTYGSATATPVFAVNAQGQITSVTNTTITPAIGNVSGLATGMLTFLQTPTSANLAATVSDETGSGSLVFATSPTLITPALGTPASGNFSSGTFTWPTFNQNTTGYAASIAGGAAGSVPYQTAINTTGFLAAGTNGQVLTLASGVPSWATPTTGTVTSVGGTGTVSGISLSGTVTSSGSLTLGGTLDLSAPPAIGGTTAAAITGTTITANTGFKGTYYDASGSGGGNLRTNSGVACFQWGAGGGTNCTVDGSINMNGANAQIDMSPTGTGHIHMNPTGSGSVQIAPTNAGTMDNLVIGGTTPLAGTFTTLRVNSTISLAGSTGTAGYALISNGASAPTWQAISAGLTVTDDTTTNATRYLTFTSATSGTITSINTASTELSFNPSLGIFNLSGATGALNIPTGTTAQRPASPVVSMVRYNTTTSSYEVYINSSWQQLSTTPYSYSASYLIAAGGGGGGGDDSRGAGGGAGGLITGTTTLAVGTTYSFVIGAGGAGGVSGGGATGAARGSNGSNSTGFSLTAIGGGGAGEGGYTSYLNGFSGGSGGGGGGVGSNAVSGGTGGSATSGQGNIGGNGSNAGSVGSSNGGGAGGGGAGGAAGNASPATPTNGGVGLQSSITGSSVYYCGGGAGGAFNGSGMTTATGGLGGGGNSVSGTGSSGTVNSGGGGGCGSTTGGAGGSGVVILSVPTANYSATTTGSPTITTSGSNTIISFTASGSYTA